VEGGASLSATPAHPLQHVRRGAPFTPIRQLTAFVVHHESCAPLLDHSLVVVGEGIQVTRHDLEGRPLSGQQDLSQDLGHKLNHPRRLSAKMEGRRLDPFQPFDADC
jgi:hypothetical protein